LREHGSYFWVKSETSGGAHKTEAITVKTIFSCLVRLCPGQNYSDKKACSSRTGYPSLPDSYINISNTAPTALNVYLDAVFIDDRIDSMASGGSIFYSSTVRSLLSYAGSEISVDEPDIAHFSSGQQQRSSLTVTAHDKCLWPDADSMTHMKH
jgi:hypothetical protein